jgi:hypothetical protein
MGDINTYSRKQRREMLKSLLKRRNLLMNGRLLGNKTYQQLTQEEFEELRTGKCTDEERQKGFDKVRKVMQELFFIDTKLNEINSDLKSKQQKKL